MKLWSIALAAWLLLTGLTQVIDLSFRYDDVVSGVIAMLAGVLLLARK